jgi:hypothetical protein
MGTSSYVVGPDLRASWIRRQSAILVEIVDPAMPGSAGREKKSPAVPGVF